MDAILPSFFRSKRSLFDLLPHHRRVSLNKINTNNLNNNSSTNNSEILLPAHAEAAAASKMMMDIEEAAGRVLTDESSRRRHPLHEDVTKNNGGFHGSSTVRLMEEATTALLPFHHTQPPPPGTSPTQPQPQPPSTSARRDISCLPTHIITTTSSGSMSQQQQQQQLDQPRVVHPVLLKLPLTFRFGCNGLFANVLFMVGYNWAVSRNPLVPASTIYSICYMIYIPLGHFMNAIFVFGWPDRYFPSLASNYPIGLTAICIGSALTAYLDRVEFNERIEEYMRDNFTFSQMPARTGIDKKSEFYSSLFVLIVTSVWTYILSVYINSPPTKSEKRD